MHPRVKKNIIAGAVALILSLISIYFGISVYNAGQFGHIQHLNEADKIFHYEADMIPSLNFRAAIFTIPFIIAIVVLEILIIRSAKVRQAKNLAIGAFAAILIVVIFDIIVVTHPYDFNFNSWGFVWVTMAAIIIWTNVLSIFVKEK